MNAKDIDGLLDMVNRTVAQVQNGKSVLIPTTFQILWERATAIWISCRESHPNTASRAFAIRRYVEQRRRDGASALAHTAELLQQLASAYVTDEYNLKHRQKRLF